MTMTSSIEDTIKKVELLYESLTGYQPPPGNGSYAPVPPEADLVLHVETQLSKLAKLVENPKPIPRPTWSPPVSLWEDEKDLIIETELAGIKKSEVEVATLQQLVTISGNRSRVPSAKRTWVNERQFGPFCRTVLLPPYVDAKSMRTSTDNGVLQIRFARRASASEYQNPDQN